MTMLSTPLSWIEDLRSVIAELAKLNGATESDFLAIGGNLMAFLTASRQLGEEIAGLTALASGEQAQNACKSLVSIRRYVEELQRRSEQDGRALLVLQSGADRIRRGFSTFGRVVLSFRMTAIAAKMEVAQIATSQQNLANLAEDVRSCIEGMGKRAVQILDVAADFDSRVAATLREVSRFDDIQLQELPSLLAAVDADVDTFRNRQQAAVNQSVKLAAQLESVTRDLGAIATAMQFHDITRQQVQHVIEALEGFLRDAAVCEISASGGTLVKLQKAQLLSAATAFARSTARIDSDLEGVAVRVGEMAADSTCIQGQSRQSHQSHNDTESFGDGMQHRFAKIARAVAELDALEHSARGIVIDMQSAKHDLGIAVNEVQSVEMQLNHISINAVASANRLGAQGAALKVIAAAFGELRRESASRSGDAKSALDSITEAMIALAGSGDSAATGVSGAALLKDIDTRVRDLENAGESAAEAAEKVAALADNLRANLQNARNQFGIGRRFADTINRSCDLLAGVALQAPASDGSIAEEALPDRYKMETERDVHRTITNVATHPPSKEVAGVLPADGGDDVEFF